MELWVRSQDKLLLTKIDYILVNGLDIFNQNQLIGTYKTYERTLEVLDEIQKIIKWYQRDMKDVTIGDMKDLKGCFDDYVYEMPKE